jgi:hypothetical protein
MRRGIGGDLAAAEVEVNSDLGQKTGLEDDDTIIYTVRLQSGTEATNHDGTFEARWKEHWNPHVELADKMST